MLNKITEIALRHKGLWNSLFLPAVVLLVGLSAFGLGRLSAGEPVQSAPQTQEQTGQAAAQPAAAYKAVNKPMPAAPAAVAPKAEQATAATGQYVASKSGTKYYLPNCPGVSRIKAENKVWFATAAEAEAAGYSAAANCPGI